MESTAFSMTPGRIGALRPDRRTPERAALGAILAVAAALAAPGGRTVLAQAGPGAGASPGRSERRDGEWEDMTLWSSLAGSGWIGIVIVVCSVVGTAMAITYTFQIRKAVLMPPELVAHVGRLLDEDAYDEAFHVCAANPCFFSSVVAAGLSRTDLGYEEMTEAMIEAGEVETSRLQQKAGYLSLVATVAPLLGLFGTVEGMIITFNEIANSALQPRPRDLADGISIALGTTYLGLVVAIPMTVVYAFFRDRVVNLVQDVGKVCGDLTARFKSGA